MPVQLAIIEPVNVLQGTQVVYYHKIMEGSGPFIIRWEPETVYALLGSLKQNLLGNAWALPKN
jgi:hypothetical protein